MPDGPRIRCKAVAGKIRTAEDAAALIPPGANVGMSGFTGSGHPKAVPVALAARIEAAAHAGERFPLGVWTGAATAPDLDGALAQVDGIDLRCPTSPIRSPARKINAGAMDYLDIHLSHVAQMAWQGFLGQLDFAVIEAAGITADGDLIPSTSVGNNKTWIDHADQVILEINSRQPDELDGFHDIYYGTAQPPHRMPVPIPQPGRPDRRARTSLPAGQDRRASCRPTPRTGATPFKPAGCDVRADRRPRHRLPPQRGGRGPPARGTCCPCSPGSATSPTRCSPGWTAARSAAHRLHRGHPGRHAGAAGLRQAAVASATAFTLSQDGHRRPARQHRGTGSGSCCGPRRSPTIPRSSAAWAAWP